MIIFFSSFSITPSSLLTSTIVLSSSSVIVSCFSSLPPESSLITIPAKKPTIIISGVSIIVKHHITPATLREIFSALAVAIVFGVISPNISTRRVTTPVARPTALLPNIFIVHVVAREDADRLTILFPISIAESILSGFSVRIITFIALLLPCSDNVLILILLTVLSAVSDAEKKADKPSSIARTNICIASEPSTYTSMCLFLIVNCFFAVTCC